MECQEVKKKKKSSCQVGKESHKSLDSVKKSCGGGGRGGGNRTGTLE